MKAFTVSPEGIPYKEYKTIKFILGAIISFLGFVIYKILIGRNKNQVIVNKQYIVENAINYGFHHETFLNSLDLCAEVYKIKKIKWLGSHSFLSYLTSLPCMFYRLPCFRYNPKSKMRPIYQIINFLTNYDGMFYLMTDSGGNYSKINPSLIKMALATNRPLVPVRNRVDRTFRLFGHYFALFPGKWEMIFGKPVYPEQLRDLSRECRIELLQDRIDEILQ